MTKQQFIINQLKPYFLDIELVATDANGYCQYCTEDDRCA